MSLNKDFEINRKQLHWKFRPDDGLFYKKQMPWEEWSEEFKEFRVEYDALWRSGLAYITYGDEDIKKGILNCFRPYIIGEHRDPEKTMYQASRASGRFGEDDASRDQIILALAALEYRGDVAQVREIANRLSFRVSRRFLMTPTMWFWVKYLGTRKQSWKNAFAFMQTLEHLINITLTKGLRFLAGATEPIPLPHDQYTKLPYKDGFRLKLYKMLGYPEYGLHFAAWQYYVVPFGGLLGKLNKKLMRWQMEDSNLLLRAMLDGRKVEQEEIDNFKSTNTFMWQRRYDVATAWIIELKPEQIEYNDLERDLLLEVLSKTTETK